jgi:hypothetical protein
MKPDPWQRIVAELAAAAGDVAKELPAGVLGIAVLALDVTENEGIVAGQLQRQGAAVAPVGP